MEDIAEFGSSPDGKKKVLGLQEPKNIVYLSSLTVLDIDPDKVLDSAIGELESVIVAGFDKNGELYTASSLADGGTMLWIIEHLKRRIIRWIIKRERK